MVGLSIRTCTVLVLDTHLHVDLSINHTPYLPLLIIKNTIIFQDQLNNEYNNLIIIINVTHISMFRNYSFNIGRNVAKRGRNMERRWERNIVEPKFELKSFRPSTCVFYGCGRI